jgi:hypothetical protein
VLPDTVPNANELEVLFKKRLQLKGDANLRLPVTPHLHAKLELSDGRLAQWLQPDTQTQAWALSVAVSSALHPEAQLHDQLHDELSVAGKLGRFHHHRFVTTITIIIAATTLPSSSRQQHYHHHIDPSFD